MGILWKSMCKWWRIDWYVSCVRGEVAGLGGLLILEYQKSASTQPSRFADPQNA
jgi:hypothetical protein